MKSRFYQTGWLASGGAPLHLRLSWEPTRAAMATVERARRAIRRTSRTMALPLARATSSAATSAFPAAAAAYNTQKTAPRSAARMNCLLLAAPSTFPPFASRNAALTSISAIARGTFSRWMDLKGEGGKERGSCYTCTALSWLTNVSSFDDCSMWRRICSADAAHISQGSGPTATGGQAAHAGGCSTPIAIIIEPARDLAEQTAKCMQDYCRFLPAIKVECFIGSADSRRGREKVDCHIAGEQSACDSCYVALLLVPLVHALANAVATPGRLLDLVQSHVLSLAKVEPRACPRAAPLPRQFGSQVRFFVLDEADRLLETGNLPTITEARAPETCPLNTHATLTRTLLARCTLECTNPIPTSVASLASSRRQRF